MVKPDSAPHLFGNVCDDEDNPVPGAKVSVDGQSLGDTPTGSNGWFQIEVKEQPAWIVRARKDGYESGKIDIDANRNHEPIRIVLKKN